MKYYEEITLKDGRKCILRNGTEADAKGALDVFILTHEQTDNLLTYPDEITMTVEDQEKYLREKTESENEIEIVAEVGGRIVGTAGIFCVGDKDKLRHRAEFGISIDGEYRGLGIGKGLTKACISCAEKAGYAQIELDVVADNENAIALYKSAGFVEYGRNPRGFRSRHTGWQELVLMRKELD